MSAVLSACGRYRYRLDRQISNSGPTYAFFGVNPSTADATVDDHTVSKWRGFCLRWGASRFIVGNLFAYRATNVSELAATNDPVGPDNLYHLLTIGFSADVLVPCWGNRAKLPRPLRERCDSTLMFLRMFNKPLMSFGLTNSGDPCHPLMLGYSTELIQI